MANCPEEKRKQSINTKTRTNGKKQIATGWKYNKVDLKSNRYHLNISSTSYNLMKNLTTNPLVFPQNTSKFWHGDTSAMQKFGFPEHAFPAVPCPTLGQGWGAQLMCVTVAQVPHGFPRLCHPPGMLGDCTLWGWDMDGVTWFMRDAYPAMDMGQVGGRVGQPWWLLLDSGGWRRCWVTLH